MSVHDIKFVHARAAFHDAADASACAYWDTARVDFHKAEAVRALYLAAAALGYRVEKVEAESHSQVECA